MNEPRDINGTPTDSEKMDISEVSDIISPTSDQSLCEMVDNAGSTSGFTSCESHPLDNAAVLASASRMTTTSQETSTSQVSNSLEQIPLDVEVDSSLRSFNGSSPAESEDDPSSVYAARVADDYQDVRLRKAQIEDIASSEDPPGLVLLCRNSQRGRHVAAEFVESAARRDQSRRVIAAPLELSDQGNTSTETMNQSNDSFGSIDQSNDSIGNLDQSNTSIESADKSKASLDGMENSGGSDSGLGESLSIGRGTKSEHNRVNTEVAGDTNIQTSTTTVAKPKPFNPTEAGRGNEGHDFHVDKKDSTANKDEHTVSDQDSITSQGLENALGTTHELSNSSAIEISSNGNRAKEEPRRIADESEASVTQHLEVDVRVNDRGGSQTANQSGGRRRIRLSPSLLRDDADSSDDSGGAELDTLADSADELDDSILERLGAAAPEPIPELSAAEELADERAWRTCRLAGTERAIDMRVIEPYKRVLSHGGYLAAGARNAIVVFSACFLPDRSRADYAYVMDNLFFYVVSTLQQLVTQDYVLVYLHGGAQRSCMPTFAWLKRCYHMLDRRLRKDLKALYLVHPTFWLKTLVLMTRPFISSKFSRKLSFVGSLEELRCILPLEQASIPERVKQADGNNSFVRLKNLLGREIVFDNSDMMSQFLQHSRANI